MFERVFSRIGPQSSLLLSFLFWPLSIYILWVKRVIFAPDYTQWHTHTIHTTSLFEGSACRRDLYLTTHNTHKRQTSILPMGFEPAIPASERPQAYALDRMSTGIGGWDKVWSRKRPWCCNTHGGGPTSKSRAVFIDIWTAKDHECFIRSGWWWLGINW